jgi:hypothetical protein
MKNIRQLLTQFLIVFLLSTLIVTLYFIHSFHALADTITFSAVLQTTTQFGLIIAIPTTILFVLVDLLVHRIKTVWILYLTRCAVLFGLLYLVSLMFSFYLISNSLLDNPFMPSN